MKEFKLSCLVGTIGMLMVVAVCNNCDDDYEGNNDDGNGVGKAGNGVE